MPGILQGETVYYRADARVDRSRERVKSPYWGTFFGCKVIKSDQIPKVPKETVELSPMCCLDCAKIWGEHHAQLVGCVCEWCGKQLNIPKSPKQTPQDAPESTLGDNTIAWDQENQRPTWGPIACGKRDTKLDKLPGDNTSG